MDLIIGSFFELHLPEGAVALIIAATAVVTLFVKLARED